jgi:hypothetical protein
MRERLEPSQPERHVARDIGQVTGAHIDGVEPHGHATRIDAEPDPRNRAWVLRAHVHGIVHLDAVRNAVRDDGHLVVGGDRLNDDGHNVGKAAPARRVFRKADDVERAARRHHHERIDVLHRIGKWRGEQDRIAGRRRGFVTDEAGGEEADS